MIYLSQNIQDMQHQTHIYLKIILDVNILIIIITPFVIFLFKYCSIQNLSLKTLKFNENYPKISKFTPLLTLILQIIFYKIL